MMKGEKNETGGGEMLQSSKKNSHVVSDYCLLPPHDIGVSKLFCERPDKVVKLCGWHSFCSTTQHQ